MGWKIHSYCFTSIKINTNKYVFVYFKSSLEHYDIGMMAWMKKKKIKWYIYKISIQKVFKIFSFMYVQLNLKHI